MSANDPDRYFVSDDGGKTWKPVDFQKMDQTIWCHRLDVLKALDTLWQGFTVQAGKHTYKCDTETLKGTNQAHMARRWEE